MACSILNSLAFQGAGVQASVVSNVLLLRQPVGKDTFLKHFWKCFTTFEQTSTEEAGMPAFFRFLTLLSRSQAFHRTSGLPKQKGSHILYVLLSASMISMRCHVWMQASKFLWTRVLM